MPAKLTRIVVADHQPIFRQGLAGILTEGGWTVAAQVNDRESLDQALDAHHPNIVILDRMVPGIDIYPYCLAVTSHYTDLQLLILTAYEQDVADMQVPALRAGAAGCLSKDHSPNVYLDAIYMLADQRVYFPHHVINRALSITDHIPVATPPPLEHPTLTSLTPREREILQMVAAGLVNPEIAGRLSIAENTVMKHVSHIMAKLKARNRMEAGLIYLRASTAVHENQPQNGEDSTPQ